MESEKLDYLVQQYKWNLGQLSRNEMELKRREYFLIIFFIYFFYTWGATIAFTYEVFGDSLLSIIIAIFFIFSHVYIFIFKFSSYYTKELDNKQDGLLKNIDELEIKINKILEKEKIDKENFYKDILKK